MKQLDPVSPGTGLHGDPFRWLETGDRRVRDWVRRQQLESRRRLDMRPVRSLLLSRFGQLWSENEPVLARHAGGRRFELRYRRGCAAPSLIMIDGGGGTSRFRPRSPDGSERVLTDLYPSPDGRYVAYAWSRHGNTELALNVMDIERGRDLADHVPANLHPLAQSYPGRATVTWSPDSGGFVYTRSPAGMPALEGRLRQCVYRHRLGEQTAEETLLFGGDLRPGQMPYAQSDEAGRHLLLTVIDQTVSPVTCEVLVGDLRSPAPVFHTVHRRSGGLVEAQLYRDWIYLACNDDTSDWAVARVPVAACGRNGPAGLETFLPRSGIGPIRQWSVAGERLLVETLESVSSRLGVYAPGGRLEQEIELPRPGSIEQLQVVDDSRARVVHSTPLTPPASYDIALGETAVRTPAPAAGGTEDFRFEVHRARCESADGTAIPLLLIHRRNLARNGSHPCVMYGYGGFGVSVMPAYNWRIVPFLEQGGIYVIVNVRGGGELGETWHRAAVRAHRQRSVDDFVAAAQWLIAQGYTRSSRLACYGWSNGGLLVNAAAVRRPDLWRAVVAGAPVTDLARYHLAPGGLHCGAEFGSPDDPADRRHLLALSPYHALPSGVDAPAILIYVGDRDDRVAPWHGYKMAARWQAANRSGRPILLLPEAGGGHQGSAAPDAATARLADIWTFLFWQLGMESPRE